jgi:hypothetical protein
MYLTVKKGSVVDMLKTVKIPEPNVEMFEAKMKKLMKISSKLNSGDVFYHLLSSKLEQYNKDEYVMFNEYEISGETPTLNGYRVVAYLEHLDGKNLVKHIDTSTVLPEGLQERDNYCEHCHNNRRRVHLFILEEEETGKQIQVGRTCVKDFTGGHLNPELIAEWYQFIEDVQGFQEIGHGSSFTNYHYNVLKVIAHSAYLTDEFGYVKSADNTVDNPSTAMRTRKSMNELDEDMLVKEGYYREAEKVVEWIFSQNITGYGYLRDLHTIAEIGLVSNSKLGLIASAYCVYKRAIEKELQEKQEMERQGKKESEHVGEVGERVTYELTFEREVTFDTAYGWMGIQFFHDKDDNVYIWKTSKYLNFEEGEVVTLKGTLKEHSEYNGVKQNVLTRCKVID